ncbi:MAG: PTS sugar transporter subunit IIA [Opitutales bacterium]
MDYSKYIAKSRIIDIESSHLEGALAEMLDCIPPHLLEENQNKDNILADLIAREQDISTYLGDGILMPHTKANIKHSYLFVVARCPEGLSFDNKSEYKDTKLIFMLLANQGHKNYLNILASLARIFSQDEIISDIIASADFANFRDKVWAVFKKRSQDSNALNIAPKMSLSTKSFMNKAKQIAKISKANTIFLLGDTFPNGLNLDTVFDDFKTLIVTERSSNFFEGKKLSFINVRAFSTKRMSQLGSALLMGITKGIIGIGDKICCIGGIKESGIVDCITVVDVAKEFSKILNFKGQLLPNDVKPEVVERILAITTELSVEGREGKPIGCLFVIGDAQNVLALSKQLVLNPFYGYKREDRSILNPFMDETVKELSMIDGAMIIDGNGVLETAGTLIHTPDFTLNLQGGLGARHAAAYSISLAADCLAIVVSSSTGIITIFRNGEILSLNEKTYF